MSYLENLVDTLLVNMGVPDTLAIYLRLFLFLLILFLFSWLAFQLTKKVFIRNIYRLFKKTSIKWDDLLVENKVFNNVAHVIPAVIVRIMAPVIFANFEKVLPVVVKLTDSYLIIVGMTILAAFLKVIEYSLSKNEIFKDKPLTSYFQLIKILLYIVALILVLSVLLGKSPLYFLSAFGAISAILLLMFKDTILGLVASVQISANDMVQDRKSVV